MSPTPFRNIYTVWMENSAKSYIQNIFVCNKLIAGGLTGTALPHWKLNVYPKSSTSEVDSVTAATTANSDFTVSAIQKKKSIRKFTLFFEIDRSFEPNDWFNDQPALLYYAEIDLDQNVSEYELKLLGWTPNNETTVKNSGTPALTTGILDKVTKYITNKRNDDGSFGDADTNSATKMVEKITAKITYAK